MSDMLRGYDTWLTGYERHPVQAWCENRECVNYADPITVSYERENGQGWITPEDCPDCKGALTLDAPRDNDD